MKAVEMSAEELQVGELSVEVQLLEMVVDVSVHMQALTAADTVCQ